MRWGTEYDATLAEFVTSDGFFVGILLPSAQALVQGDLFLFETRSDLLLARVEENYPVRYTCRLVRLKEPFIEGGVEFRWTHQDGLLTGKERQFRVTRHAPLAVQAEEQALAVFQNMEPETIRDVLGWEDALDIPGRDLEQAKWKVQKDMHGQAIRALEELDETERADMSLTDEAAKQFAIDLMAVTI